MESKHTKKQALEPIIQTVNSSHHFFDTEILVRAQYQGYKIKEIPVSTAELRKTRFTLSIRAYQALRELITLIRNREKMMHQYRPEVALIADDFGYWKETDVKMLQLLKKGGAGAGFGYCKLLCRSPKLSSNLVNE